MKKGRREGVRRERKREGGKEGGGGGGTGLRNKCLLTLIVTLMTHSEPLPVPLSSLMCECERE